VIYAPAGPRRTRRSFVIALRLIPQVVQNESGQDHRQRDFLAEEPRWLFRDSREDELRATFRAEPTLLQQLQDESALLGYTVTAHPLDCYPDGRLAHLLPHYRAAPLPQSRRHHLWPHRRHTPHRQQNGQPMKFISLSFCRCLPHLRPQHRSLSRLPGHGYDEAV
jgi:hypothetical protein